MIPIQVQMTVSEQSPINLSVSSSNEFFNLGIATPITMVSGTPYTGSYEITPSDSTQTLNTEFLYMTGNVTINPIPNNYGLITWDGSTLTVS